MIIFESDISDIQTTSELATLFPSISQGAVHGTYESVVGSVKNTDFLKNYDTRIRILTTIFEYIEDTYTLG